MPPFSVCVKLPYIFSDHYASGLSENSEVVLICLLAKECSHFLVVDGTQILMKAPNLFKKEREKKRERYTTQNSIQFQGFRG